MEPSRPSGSAAQGEAQHHTLPGIAAFLRPHAHLPSSTDSAVAAFKREREDRLAYASSSTSSMFTRGFRRPEDHYDDHVQHPHHHPYGLSSFRPPVVAPAPLAYGLATYSPHATFKPRKVHSHDSPSASARRVLEPPRLVSASMVAAGAALTSGLSERNAHPHNHQQHRQSVRTSRYLREIDRRAILQRIQNGEKQADLAKEYQVSRAAISNLKQRRRLKDKQQAATSPPGGGGDEEEDDGDDREDEYGSTATAGSNGLRRPRRRRHSSDESSTPSEPLVRDDDDDDAVRAVAALRLARRQLYTSGVSPTASVPSPTSPTRRRSISSASPPALTLMHDCVVGGSSIPLLLSQLQHGVGSATPSAVVRATAQRLARLLLEETLGRLPTRSLELHDSTMDSDKLVVPARHVCAVAVNDGRGSQLLLDEFRAIEPLCGVGAVQTQLRHSPSNAEAPPATLVHVPEQLADASVLLLDLVCSRTGEEICASLETLRAHGVDPQNVFVATLVGFESGVARVSDAFPQLGALVTTKLLRSAPSTGAGAPALRDFAWELQKRLAATP